MGPTSLRRSRDAWTPTRACEPRKVSLTIACTNCKQYGYAIALDLNITPKAKCLLFTHTHTHTLFLHNSSSWFLSSSQLLRLYETIINIWWFFFFFCQMPKKYFSNHFSRLQKITTFPEKIFSPKNFFFLTKYFTPKQIRPYCSFGLMHDFQNALFERKKKKIDFKTKCCV
jgi:hypothetical protein